MEKLTLKEIAGYLPYNLKILCDSKNYISTMIGLHSNGIDDDFGNNWDLEVKPILYPLEMLTKTIVHNGVEIIPIVEIAKISNSVNEILRIGDKKVICGFDFIDGSGEKMRFCYHKITNHFQLTYVDEDFRNDCVLNQLQMFERLHEFHMDIHNLIGRGLAVSKAIDKSTLNSK